MPKTASQTRQRADEIRDEAEPDDTLIARYVAAVAYYRRLCALIDAKLLLNGDFFDG